MNNDRLKIRTIVGLAMVIMASALLLYIFLPVPYTVYSQPNDGTLTAADPVTSQTPLQQCIEGDFHNLSGIKLLLATYQRVNKNTNHLEIFMSQNNQKNTIFQTDFSSQPLQDNDYYRIDFPQIPEISKFCFLLTSSDATEQNSITYWMNSQSQPVLKLISTQPLYKAIQKVVEASPFGLPIWLAVALCLLYLCANIAAIFLIWNEATTLKKVSKAAPSHPRGTRQKRI